MQQLFDACWWELPSNPNLATTLDNVDYADIDTNGEAPIKEC